MGFALLVLASLASLVVNAKRSLFHFSGDALIHLIFAENMAHGHPLQFNAGVPSSGSTSILWNGIEAVALRLLGLEAGIYAISALCVLAWLGAGCVAFATSRSLGATSRWALGGALVAVAAPGTAYNAPGGMEAPVFALAVAGLQYLLSTRPSATSELRGQLVRDVSLCVVAALAANLRPEGVMVALAVVPLLFLAGRARKNTAPSVQATTRPPLPLAVALSVLATLVAMTLVHHAATHLWLPGSAVARVAAARRGAETLFVAGIPVYVRPVLRFAAYAPFVALGVFGLLRSAHAGGLGAKFALTSLTLGLGTYTFATGATHAARYLMWTWFLLAPGFALACTRLSLDRVRSRALVASALAATACVFAAETWARAREGAQSGGYTIPTLVAGARDRVAHTDALLRALPPRRAAGAPAKVAFIEVQGRWFYDDRVYVESLDGRTSPAPQKGRDYPDLIAFDGRGCPNLDPLLNDPTLDALFEDPSYDGAHCPPSPVVQAASKALRGSAATNDAGAARWVPLVISTGEHAVRRADRTTQ